MVHSTLTGKRAGIVGSAPTQPERPRLRGSGGGEASPLECREHRPTHLIHVLVMPDARPVADGADANTRRVINDLEHPAGTGFAESLIPEMALCDLLGTFGPAQVRHHHRIAK
jgi:hypothetical protein